MFEERFSNYVRVLALAAAIQIAGAAGAALSIGSASADQAVSTQPLPAPTSPAQSKPGQTKAAPPKAGQANSGQMSGAPLEGGQAGNLHICNADEITSLPVLQSDSAYDCINTQNYDETPKALMCGSGGKAFCCTQNVDQLGKCTPIIGGKKRSAPLHETTPAGEPGSMGTTPMENVPMDGMPTEKTPPQ